MKYLNKFLVTVTLFSIVFLTIPSNGNAVVSVRGYYRKDGTYVQPHYRSDPDGIPTNNWSYPGNTNPYTGEVAPGNPDTYLNNYYGGSASPSVSSPLPAYSVPTQNNSASNLIGAPSFATLDLVDGSLVKTVNSPSVYYIKDGRRNVFISATHFKLYGFNFSQVRVVSQTSLEKYPFAVAMYPIGTLFKTIFSDEVWLVTRQSDGVTLERKLIPDPEVFKKCFGTWDRVQLLNYNNEAAGLWYGNTISSAGCK